MKNQLLSSDIMQKYPALPGITTDPITQEITILSLIARETINAIIITNLEGRITWVNEAFTKTTGYTFNEAVGQMPGPLLSCPEKNMKTKRFIDEKVQRQESFRVEIENRKKSGGTFWWEVYYQPLYDQHGNIVCFFSLNTDITEKKALQNQLDKERDEFTKQITLAAIQAQEKERSIVSRELHDNVNQVLTTVKLYTELCVSGSLHPNEILPQCTRLLNETINEIRMLSSRLSPPTLGEGNIKETLGQLLKSVEETQKVSIHFDHSSIQFSCIDDALHLALYRIAQEHLTNILKHAEATIVYVFLELKDTKLTLRIKDDGKGFNPKTKHSGIGIANITSRAQTLNGKVIIASSEGNGCTLTVSFPVKIENDICLL